MSVALIREDLRRLLLAAEGASEGRAASGSVRDGLYRLRPDGLLHDSDGRYRFR
jgi:hypothetical protein